MTEYECLAKTKTGCAAMKEVKPRLSMRVIPNFGFGCMNMTTGQTILDVSLNETFLDIRDFACSSV